MKLNDLSNVRLDDRAYNFFAFHDHIQEIWLNDQKVFTEVPRKADGSLDDDNLTYFTRSEFPDFS
jgi:hypothetical protein|tara:strand:- start:75 stop:269 length:195 start_codon:yes stop_codon:yes gene_type:complete